MSKQSTGLIIDVALTKLVISHLLRDNPEASQNARQAIEYFRSGTDDDNKAEVDRFLSQVFPKG